MKGLNEQETGAVFDMLADLVKLPLAELRALRVKLAASRSPWLPILDKVIAGKTA